MLDFLKSRTVIASVIGFFITVASFFGVQTGALDANGLTDAVMQIITAVTFIATAVFRVFPRWQPK